MSRAYIDKNVSDKPMLVNTHCHLSAVAFSIRSLDVAPRSRHIVHALRRSMLFPVALPHVPGLTFDRAYRTAENMAVIGGDWYDTLVLASGKIAVVIGDVVGHGSYAAAVMCLVRESIRAAALEGASPSEALMLGNRTILKGGVMTATAFVGLLDPVTMVLEYANAGHPPPLVVKSGRASALESDGLPLGVDIHAEYGTKVATLMGANALVLFTDGLIEYDHNGIAGEARLRGILEGWAASGFVDDAKHLVDVTLGERLPRDDIALFIVRFEGSVAPVYELIANNSRPCRYLCKSKCNEFHNS
jgi:serine phosphatase RsbU (regulator of sigma subunit)